jgi:hypothetical protein
MVQKNLFYRDNFFNIADFLPQNPFDAHFQRHSGAGTSLARPLQANPHGFIRINADQFNVTAVILQHRPDRVDHLGHFCFKRFIAASATITHSYTPHINF